MQSEHTLYSLDYNSPYGVLRIKSNGESITNITRLQATNTNELQPDSICLAAKSELEAYFAGDIKSFMVPLTFSCGTPFQQSVWEELKSIPYGKTYSYNELSYRMGTPKAIRAIASANGRNPILIMVPCHRVIGSDGSLTGFSAGLDMKRGLLELELKEKVGVQSSLF